MTRIKSTLAALASAFILSSALPACTPEQPAYEYPAADDGVRAKVTSAEATAIAQAALAGYNSGDYGLFTTRWSESMRAGVTEPAFQAFRTQKMEEAGRFLSILDVKLTAAQTPGHVRYAFRCAFERREQVLVHVYPEGGDEIVGAHLLGADSQ